MPKYKGTNLNSEGSFKCEICFHIVMSFGTQRGLSTHERHAHLAVRNVKRRGTDPPNMKNWTVEEVSLRKELEETYKHFKYPNIEVSKVLTSKTIEQIKNKRKNMKISSEDSSTQGGGVSRRQQREGAILLTQAMRQGTE